MKIIAIWVVAMMFLTTASATEFITDPVGFQKFDHVVDVHYCKPFSQANLETLKDGDTLENDFFTRWLLETYNINMILDWSAPSGNDYNQKIGMCIASDDLPDVFTAGYNYWKEAAENEMLLDTTELFQTYASEKIKNAYEVGGHFAMDTCSIDGVMYGLSNLAVTADGYTVMEIRKDWLDELGLKMPTTIDELHDVLVEFRNAKLAGEETLPMVVGNSLYSNWANSANHSLGLDPILSALGAYPGFFLEEGGHATYSTFTPEMRSALELLNTWYEEGLIDPEMGARIDSDIDEEINAGHVGVFCGPWWTIGYGHADSFYNNENVNWQAIVLNNENGEWTCKHPFTFGTNFVCINANVTDEVAQAIMTVVNVINLYETDLNQMTAETLDLLPLRNVYDTPDIVEHEYIELNKIINGNATSADYADERIYTFLPNDAVNVEKLIQNYIPGELLERKHFVVSSDDINWQRLYSIMVNSINTATKTVAYEPVSLIYVQNDITAKYWDNLINNENTICTQIIIGQAEINAFDAFEEQWLKEGGQKLLDMLNEDLAK